MATSVLFSEDEGSPTDDSDFAPRMSETSELSAGSDLGPSRSTTGRGGGMRPTKSAATALKGFSQENIAAQWSAEVTPEAHYALVEDVTQLRRSIVNLCSTMSAMTSTDSFMEDEGSSAEPESRSPSHRLAGRDPITIALQELELDLEDGEATPSLPNSTSAPYRSPHVPVLRPDFMQRALGESEGVEQEDQESEYASSRKPESERDVSTWRRWFVSFRIRAAAIMEKPAWQITFMVLTIYALFSSDLDKRYGSKTSEEVIMWVSTVAFVLFGLEFSMQATSKDGYLLRPLFWLDLVALLSMLPDTWFVHSATSSNQFVAARSTKVTRVLRVASRSTRASRMNRLIRIIRVATLLPRIAKTAGYRRRNDEVKNLANHKLQQIYDCISGDQHGHGGGRVTKDEMEACIKRINKLYAGMHRAASASGSASEMPPTMSTSTHTTERSQTRHHTFGSEVPVSREDFKKAMLEDEVVRHVLHHKCLEQVNRSNNMQAIAARHSEDLGIKVALGVLSVLFVQTFVEPSVTNNADILGLQQLEHHVYSGLVSTSGSISEAFQKHAGVYADGIATDSAEKRWVLYLDVGHHEYCNSLVDLGNLCPPEGSSPEVWVPRRKMSDIDTMLLNSPYRVNTDLQVIRLPLSVDDASEDMDDEELNRTITSLAILDIRASQESSAMDSFYTTLLVIALILLGIFALTRDMTFLSRRLLKPLRRLADDMRDIVKFNVAALQDEEEEEEQALEHIAEIDRLREKFKSMKKAIRSWAKYVPMPVVELLLQVGETGVREADVTIFFSDIASFTSIVEKLDPEQSLWLLSRYFQDMSKVIDDHKGIVIEFIGDAILAVYGSPIQDELHAESGVKATLKMLLHLQRINRWSVSKGLPEVKIRCGVHTGKATIGNMGFHSRLKYGVIGENSTLPGRLEELNKEYSTENLISHSTFMELRPGTFVIRPIDFINLRPHDSGPELVYQALGRTNSYMGAKLKPVAALHTRGMLHYRQGSFKKAASIFGKVNKLMKATLLVAEDFPSLLMQRRCLAYAERPPQRAWNGVFDGVTTEPSVERIGKSNR